MLSKDNLPRTQVILLRHGQSTYNALSLYQGCSDRPTLTDLGIEQAHTAAQFFKKIHLDAIYTSPLRRVQQTAQVIYKQLQQPQPYLETCADLRETDLPLWQGLPIEQVKEQFPQDYHNWKHRPQNFSMEVPQQVNGYHQPNSLEVITETFHPALALYSRIEKFWPRILARHHNQTVLIISHSGTNKALMSTALGISPAYYHCFEQSNCSLNLLSFAKRNYQSAQLVTMNHPLGSSSLPATPKGGLRLIFFPSRGELPPDSASVSVLLEKEKIDFTLSQQPESPLAHPHNPVHFPVLHHDFAKIWHQALTQKSFVNHAQLLTGLIVAQPEQLEKFLAQILPHTGGLSLSPHTLSSVYFPNSGELPCLQTFNLGIIR